MMVEILGVHPIDSTEPCHLIEMQVSPWDDKFDWNEVTQEAADQPRSNWQVAYDETPLDYSKTRWALFFHYLDPSKPLLTASGAAISSHTNSAPLSLEAHQVR